MRKIEITNLDKNLLADINGSTEGYELHEQPAECASGDWQILWSAEAGRAGMVFVGGGSDGRTFWTDAKSPEDAYQQLQSDELSA